MKIILLCTTNQWNFSMHDSTKRNVIYSGLDNANLPERPQERRHLGNRCQESLRRRVPFETSFLIWLVSRFYSRWWLFEERFRRSCMQVSMDNNYYKGLIRIIIYYRGFIIRGVFRCHYRGNNNNHNNNYNTSVIALLL